MDAVSFVLGVRSSQLRSGNLKELIHRKTLQEPAADGASVEAVVEFQGDIIRFKRVITSAGTSEYLLDGNSVRWSEYNDALQRINILVKARNFLVFQGDVETVASQSSKDLARLIEQISGSEEYKSEYDRLKLEQERAIENSSLNFNKRRGIHAEIRQFKEQKEEADRYEKVANEREEYIVTHLLWKLFHIDDQVSKLSTSTNEKNSTFLQLQHDKSVIEEKWKELKKDLAKLQKKKLKAEKDLVTGAKTIEEKLPENIRNSEEISLAEKKLKSHQSSSVKIEKEIERMSDELKELEKQLQDMNRMSKKFEETVDKSSALDGVSLSEEQIKVYQSLRANVDTQMHEELKSMKELQSEMQLKDSAIDNLRADALKLENMRDDLVKERSGFEDRREKVLKYIDNANGERDAMKQSLSKIGAEKKRLDKVEQEAEERLAKTYALLSQVKYNKRENERKTRLRSAIETLKRLYSGVHGYLSELGKPSHKESELAIMKVIGKHLDSIIVEDTKTAMECIQYLKEQQVGLATFLPMDSVQAKPPNEKFRSLGPKVSLAIDLLQFDELYRPIFEYSCGNAIICDDIQTAKNICFEKNQNVKAVTLDGTIIHKSGLITGGLTDDDSHNVWEEKEVEKLHMLKQQYEQELYDIQRSKQKLANEDDIVMTLSSIEGSLATATEDLNVIIKKLTSIDAELKNANKDLKDLEKDIKKEVAAVQKIQAEHKKFDNIVFNVEMKQFDALCKKLGIASIRDYEGRFYKTQKENADKRTAFAAQISRIENEIIFIKEQMNALSKKSADAKKNISDEQERLSELQKIRQHLSKHETSLAEQTAEATKAMSDIELELRELEGNCNVKKRLIIECQREMDAITKSVISMESQLDKLFAERLSIFRRCKLEEIELPVVEGSLEDIISDETSATQESMDMDSTGVSGSSRTLNYVRSIKVNFKNLKKDLKTDARESKETELLEKVKILTAEMERMAPNLKAIEKYSYLVYS